jgi:hypothetical protein
LLRLLTVFLSAISNGYANVSKDTSRRAMLSPFSHTAFPPFTSLTVIPISGAGIPEHQTKSLAAACRVR